MSSNQLLTVFLLRVSMPIHSLSTATKPPSIARLRLSNASVFAPYIVAALLVGGMFLASPNFRWTPASDANPFAGDFLQEWIGGHAVRQTDHARFYEPSYVQWLEHNEQLTGFAWHPDRYLPLVYPPFYYLLLTPLSYLPYKMAALVWALLMIAALAAAWYCFLLVCRQMHCDQGTALVDARLVWLLPAAIAFMPLIESLTSIQKGTLLLCILSATYLLLVKRHDFWAGVVFGLIAFKPQFALPIAVAMIMKQQWRFVAGGLLAGMLLAGLSLAMGLDVCRQYVDFSLHAGEYLQNAGYDLTKSHAWFGFFTLLLGHDWLLPVRGLTLAADAITIALVAASLRGPLLPGSERFARQFSILIVATLLLSPHLYTYDLTVLLLPLGQIAAGHLLGERRSLRTSRWLSYCSLALYCFAGLSPQLAAISNIQTTVPLLCVFLWANKKAADIAADGLCLEPKIA